MEQSKIYSLIRLHKLRDLYILRSQDDDRLVNGSGDGQLSECLQMESDLTKIREGSPSKICNDTTVTWTEGSNAQ